ncbi:MAG: hypothetical protein GY847_19100 [Proteobacteria bacterium]|nr:hypothetical protein [Pseudomonadota bacterium]
MNWSKLYRQHIDRNIGILTKEQQETLRTSKVAVLGLGGIGGTCFEVLVRSGIGSFSIVDKDIFESTNLNRQVFAFHSTLGRSKIDVAERFALDINPDVIVSKYEKVTIENVQQVLQGVDAVVLAIDELKPCLIVSRKSRELKIPLIEGWGVPYCNVRVITTETPTLEDAYDLPTKGRSISDFTDEDLKKINRDKVLMSLGKIKGIADFYSVNATDILSSGRMPTFGPIVWLSSLFMVIETIKVLLQWGDIAYGPDWSLYDPVHRRIPNDCAE